MPIYLLNDELVFPDPHDGSEEGILAVGGDLSSDRLLLAYEMGIFPWFSPPDPILWWSPDPRCVLQLNELKISKSMRNVLNQKKFSVTMDTSFEEVVRACQDAPRKEDGTWITDDIITAYNALHELGVAHSVEVWEGDELAGGLYGVSLGSMFFGESMFARKSNASKVGFITLVQLLETKGFEMIDCQVYNDHLGSLGAKDITREVFHSHLEHALTSPTLKGNWSSFLPLT
ncbi:MAG: leucyl/phenylalanyl-tRNA--protein transferase [Flavobacteriales bacterium]|nr:leucyl/phenylalanyl-tRNA--protein transferase [Flavobacteriales bacterium]MDG2244970.1 leucyl/phenylalanyl-tRNA--protein transferase [Flavobacteriales bacterium]